MQENEDLNLGRSVPVERGTELQVTLCSGMCVANNLSTESHWNLTLLPRHARRQVSRQGSHKGLTCPVPSATCLPHLLAPSIFLGRVQGVWPQGEVG